MFGQLGSCWQGGGGWLVAANLWSYFFFAKGGSGHHLGVISSWFLSNIECVPKLCMSHDSLEWFLTLKNATMVAPYFYHGGTRFLPWCHHVFIEDHLFSGQCPKTWHLHGGKNC
jgi:hypothetical protein